MSNDNYDDNNNNHRVGRYDGGLVKGNDLVTNEREENSDATSLVPCILSSFKSISIVTIVVLLVLMIIT